MPTLEATVKFKTYVTAGQTLGSIPHDVIKSRISNAREIQIIDYKVLNE